MKFQGDGKGSFADLLATPISNSASSTFVRGAWQLVSLVHIMQRHTIITLTGVIATDHKRRTIGFLTLRQILSVVVEASLARDTTAIQQLALDDLTTRLVATHTNVAPVTPGLVDEALSDILTDTLSYRQC